LAATHDPDHGRRGQPPAGRRFDMANRREGRGGAQGDLVVRKNVPPGRSRQDGRKKRRPRIRVIDDPACGPRPAISGGTASVEGRRGAGPGPGSYVCPHLLRGQSRLRTPPSGLPRWLLRPWKLAGFLAEPAAQAVRADKTWGMAGRATTMERGRQPDSRHSVSLFLTSRNRSFHFACGRRHAAAANNEGSLVGADGHPPSGRTPAALVLKKLPARDVGNKAGPWVHLGLPAEGWCPLAWAGAVPAMIHALSGRMAS